MPIARRANPGKFAVIGWHTDSSEGREFFTFNTDTREDALGLRDTYERDSREHGYRSSFGVYDEHGNRIDATPLEGVCYFHSETGTEGGDWAFQDSRYISPPEPGLSNERWSYEGLHVLRDGDRLTILSPDNPQQVVWSGTISLRQHPLFTEVASGFWIHADQDGVTRDTWAEYFFKNYPAKLVPAPEPKK